MTDRPAVHEIAARGFAAAADAYERARPDYPPDAVAMIVDRLDLRPGRTLLELGAGTGKLTRLLVPSGARILALEPVGPMRAKLAETAPTVEVIEGTAEAIPIAAGSVDAVVVAQAFHWFDAVRALSEIHRVLRPGGRLLLAWNRRDETVPWVKGLGELVHRFEAGEPGVRDGRWEPALARIGLFEPFESGHFHHRQSLSREGVHDRVLSVSYVAAADEATRSSVVADLDRLLDADPETAGHEVVELPYDTEVMWATRRSPQPGDTGIVATVNVNSGGVPKPPIDGARILAAGLEGDGHADPVHGGERAAVCLYAQEAIERVRADGHQAFPGAYGENLTVLGLDWPALRPGDRLAFGDAETGPLLELTQHAAPCQTQVHWFLEGRIARISPKVHPEDARWYARVLREGPVAPGTPIRRLAGE